MRYTLAIYLSTLSRICHAFPSPTTMDYHPWTVRLRAMYFLIAAVSWQCLVFLTRINSTGKNSVNVSLFSLLLPVSEPRLMLRFVGCRIHKWSDFERQISAGGKDVRRGRGYAFGPYASLFFFLFYYSLFWDSCKSDRNAPRKGCRVAPVVSSSVHPVKFHYIVGQAIDERKRGTIFFLLLLSRGGKGSCSSRIPGVRQLLREWSAHTVRKSTVS